MQFHVHPRSFLTTNLSLASQDDPCLLPKLNSRQRPQRHSRVIRSTGNGQVVRSSDHSITTRCNFHNFE
jgi:hypothetical protein